MLLAVAPPVVAQPRFEIAGAVTWTGGYDAGGMDALLSRPSSGSAPLTLFATSSRMGAAAGALARAAWLVTPRLAVEALVEYSRPTLRTTVLNDFENATGTEATSVIASYLFGGSVRYAFGGARLAPFVSGGAGWLRQLDGDQANTITGAEVHAGGGVTYGLTRRLTLRVDAGISSREKSVAFEQKRRAVPVASTSLSFRF
jgi:hypothetical protein